MKVTPLKKALLLPLVIIFIILLNIFGFNYFMKSYENLDDKQNKQNITSIISNIETQYKNIVSITKDYANWDDTYEFVQNKNERYIYNNFREEETILENLALDFMSFVNLDNEIIHTIYSSNITNKDHFLEILNKKLKSDKLNKVIKIENKYILITKNSVRKSDLTGDVKGYIISGVELNTDDIENLEIMTNLSNNIDLSYEVNNSTFGKINIDVTYLKKKMINYIHLQNNKNEKILSFEYKYARDIYLNGKNHVLFYNFIISILCFIMYFIFYKFINYQEILNKELKKKVEEEILKQREQEQILIQQAKLASMGEMIGNIAHQWRQPLNALGLTLQNINYSYQLGDLNEEFMNKSITKSNLLISNMSKTIDDFRNFFRPDKEKEVFTINKTVADSLEMMMGTFINLNIEIFPQYEEENIQIFGLENELSQVLLIMLSNAKDALVIDQIDNSKIEINTYKEDTNICISIKDNAKGIKKDIHDKIFEPYFTTKIHNNGTGIGLYMAKIIIEKNMNGKITFKTSEKGTEFIIKLKMN